MPLHRNANVEQFSLLMAKLLDPMLYMPEGTDRAAHEVSLECLMRLANLFGPSMCLYMKYY